MNQSVEEARKDFLEKATKGHVRCPCCGNSARVYKRKLNAGMARGLIVIHKLNKDSDGWLFISKKSLGYEKRSVLFDLEYSKLVHWGLLETKYGEKVNAGYWRLTNKGVDFVEGKISVPRHIYLMNNECINSSDELITIKEALGDGFDYNELMDAPVE